MKVVGKLYLSPTSPAARAVLLTEKTLGIKTEQILIDIKKGEHLTPEFIKLNPQHTVPTFIDKDGAIIWDSYAIMPFLIGKYAKDDSLYPKDLIQRAVVDQRLHFETGVVYPLLKSIVLPIVQQRSKETNEEALLEAGKVYGFLEAFLENGKWIAGNSTTIADFSLIASITSLEHFVPIEQGKYPSLHKWVQNCKLLPYFEEANAGLKVFKEFIDTLKSTS